MRNQTKGGFTLVELMVVISIIGVLASIAYASLTSAKAKAVGTVTYSAARQYDTAIQSFYLDNGYYPWGTAEYGVTTCLGNSLSCYASWNTPSTINPDPIIMSQLVPKYMSTGINLPNNSTMTVVNVGGIPGNNISVQGIIYGCDSTVNGGSGCQKAFLFWAQSGTKCQFSNDPADDYSDGTNVDCYEKYGW